MDSPPPTSPKIQVKERKEYQTDWSLYNKVGIDKTIYDVIQEFMERTRAFRHKELWAKYIDCLYVSGARRRELFCTNPYIQKIIRKGRVYYKIRRTSCKHFEGRKLKQVGPVERDEYGRRRRKSPTQELYKPHRKMLTQIWRPRNNYEIALFEFLLDGKMETTIDFTPLLQSRSMRQEKINRLQAELYEGRDPIVEKLMSEITKKFKILFKADITNGHNRIEYGGLVPHMLRHIRAYNIRVEKHIPDYMIQRLLDWQEGMVDYYTDIANAMQEEEEFDLYERLEPEEKMM